MDLSSFRMSLFDAANWSRGSSLWIALIVAGFAMPICPGAPTDEMLIALSKDPSALAAGKETYQTVCFSCHGQRLEGGTGFNLRDGEWVHGAAPTQILASIAKGFPEKGMVAFGSVYDESTLGQVVAYILSEQIGFRGLSYQIFHSAPTSVSLERLTQSRPTKSGMLPNNYSDATLAEVDDFAMVFEGTLLVPDEGRHFIKISKGRKDVVKVEVDGEESRAIDVGNREYQFAVKNGRQQVRLSYLKKEANPRFQVFLTGDNLYEPLSIAARNRLRQTNYFVKATERPIVIRKKIEHLPPKSIAVGYPGSLNYGYSPVTNSIVGLWDGEFLNVGPNIDGRGKDASRILGEWLFHDSPGIQLLVEGEPFAGSFVKYTVGDYPRFEYADEKRRVRISASPNGLKSIRFHFELEGFGKKRITLRLPEDDLNLESTDGAVLVGRFIVDKAKRNQFSITLTKQKTVMDFGIQIAKQHCLALLFAGLWCCVGAKAQVRYAPEGYSIETVETPEGVRFSATGLDIDDNGTLWVATRVGEVWRLEDGGDWALFASGLHEPAGLLCDDDGTIVVAQKPELTRLVDLDRDGVADEYIQVTSEFDFHDNYHEYHYGPVKDAAGVYHGLLNLDHQAQGTLNLGGAMGSVGGFRGWGYRVFPDGTFEPYAVGLRSPAGLGMSPWGEIFCIDNQGDWVATSKLHLLEPGKFYGHPVSLRDRGGYSVELINAGREEDFDRFREIPAIWIPNVEVANSPGNPEWDTTGGKFGPFAGQIFVGDQTQSNLFRMSLQKVKGVYQGMVINFLDGFQSGNIRLRFDDAGTLWVGQTGRGWKSKGGKLYGLQKVVWDGTNPFEILDIKLTDTGFNITFTENLDQTQIDVGTVTVQRYHYPYTRNYGAPKTDLETVEVQSVNLLIDGRTLAVKLPLLAGKVYEFEINRLQSLSGRRVSVPKAYYTLNELVYPQREF